MPAPRALVVSVDLPLVPALVQTFRQTGLLSTNNTIDPYGPDTSGFHPAEAIAALTIEPSTSDRSHPEILAYAANSDAHSSVALQNHAAAASPIRLPPTACRAVRQPGESYAG